MQRDPQDDRAALEAVEAALRAGDHARAAALAQSALATGLEHPLLLNVAALGFERHGRLAEAEALLRRAVEIAPADIGARNAWGLCLLQLERPREALVQFDVLIASKPELPFVHVSRGNALRALGEATQAEASYRRALALDERQALAWSGLAQIAAHRGSYPEARFRAQKALAIVSDLPDALLSLAAAEYGERQLAEAEARIRRLLESGQLTPLQHAHANGLLGDILDAADRRVEAFAAYSACNEALRELYSDRFAESGALQYVRELTRYFERAPREIWAQRPGPDSSAPAAIRHVFLLGFPRSGTTLLEVILEGHPDVVSLEEKDSMIEAVREFMRDSRGLDRLCRAPPAALEALRRAYWKRIADAGLDVRGKLFLDKYPLNTLKLPLIARLFPDAWILFACRDPRDVVLSCFRHRFQMSAPIYELLSIESAARYYDATMDFAIRMTSLLPIKVCLVRHEDVVTEFAREIKRICDFLGLEWHPGMGDFALRTKERPVLTPSTAQLVRGLNTEGIGHWRRYRPQLGGVMELLEPWVKRFYYDA